MAGQTPSFVRSTIASGGTPQQISSSFNNVKKAVFFAPYANTALVKIGLTGFSTHYRSLQPGQEIVRENIDLSAYYVDGTTSDVLEVEIFT